MDVAKAIAWQEKNPRFASFFTVRRIGQILYALPGVSIGLSIFAALWASAVVYNMVMRNVNHVLNIPGTVPLLIFIPLFVVMTILCVSIAYAISRNVISHIDILGKLHIPGLNLLVSLGYSLASLGFFGISTIALYGMFVAENIPIVLDYVMRVPVGFGFGIFCLWYWRKLVMEDS